MDEDMKIVVQYEILSFQRGIDVFTFQLSMYTEYIDFMSTLLVKGDVMIQCDVYSIGIYTRTHTLICKDIDQTR